ncbi:MAG: hypothetical protein HY760_01910 [Nitrospirae bacterium]|nr:hypothetical protein [Nitrospirota bacterium]
MFFLTIFVYNGTAPVWAEEPPPEEKKIRLEKVQIIGAVERPGTFYLVPWRAPDSQEKVNFEFSRDLKKEIFEFVDRESWTRRMHGDDR